MEIIINKIFNHCILTKGLDRIERKVIKGDTLKECFLQIYELERSARYNNYLNYDFVNPDMKKAYREWKNKNETIELYYGGGVVD